MAGVAPAALADTFTDARGSGRRHEALDIMAPRGTPVMAVEDGQWRSSISAWRRRDLRLRPFPGRALDYYYAHLDRYAPGLAEGQQVRRGNVIGFVGSTGNASPEGRTHSRSTRWRPPALVGGGGDQSLSTCWRAGSR